jgi:phosphonate transport system substrate-binding protein
MSLSASTSSLVAALLLTVAGLSDAQTCTSHGDLDLAYCDQNKDLVADAPSAAKQVNPPKLVVGLAAFEDEATTKRTYEGFIEDLGVCMKRPVSLFYAAKEAQVIEAMRIGKVHVASFGAGATMFAVNMAGAVPFAGRGKSGENQIDSYQLIVLVKASSPYKAMNDLRGKKIAHSSPTSNSGNLAPRALFPALGLVPEKDYKVEFSGKHDKSIIGVGLGFYDAAATASDVYKHMIERKEIDPKDYRIIYTSENFPTDAFSYSYDLDSKVAVELKHCFFDYKFNALMSKALENNNTFFPLNYQKDWQLVRVVAKVAGQKMDREAYRKLLESASKK